MVCILNVSYDQVYSWVKKFKELGEAGLEDRRGKKTEDQVPRTAEEKMKIRIAQLEHDMCLLIHIFTQSVISR